MVHNAERQVDVEHEPRRVDVKHVPDDVKYAHAQHEPIANLEGSRWRCNHRRSGPSRQLSRVGQQLPDAFCWRVNDVRRADVGFSGHDFKRCYAYHQTPLTGSCLAGVEPISRTVTEELDRLAAFTVRHDDCRGEIGVTSAARPDGDWQFALICSGCGDTLTVALTPDECRRHLLALARAGGLSGTEDELWSSERDLMRLVESSPTLDAFRRNWARRATQTKH
jgi:hypothetical protein